MASGRQPAFGPTSEWPQRLEEWMRFHGWLDNPTP